MAVPRRTFLLSAAAAVAGHAVLPSDQVTLKVIRLGRSGTFVTGVFQKDPALRVSGPRIRGTVDALRVAALLN